MTLLNSVLFFYLNGYPTDATTSPNDSVARLNGSGQKVGPSLVLKVMGGDTVNLAVKYFYRGSGSAGAGSDPLNDIVGVLAGGIVGTTGELKGSLLELNNTSTSPLVGALNSFRTTNNPATTNKPKAYLNWILLDEQLKYVPASSGAAVVGSAESLQALTTLIEVSKNGFLYIYVSNETQNWDVFFDNLSVQHVSGRIMEETHYYPFGLTMAGISSKAAGSLVNRKKFNDGNELQSQEFSDGSGLEWYDAKNRMYDPQLGRFFQIDALTDMSQNMSPYVFGSNNPISIDDPLGLQDSVRTLPTVTVTAYVKNKWNQFSNWFTGANVGYNGSGWGHGPRQWMANQFGLGNNANNLFQLGLHSQLQSKQVNLTGSLLNQIKSDPAMIAFQNKIIAALKADPRFKKLSFILKAVTGFNLVVKDGAVKMKTGEL